MLKKMFSSPIMPITIWALLFGIIVYGGIHNYKKNQIQQQYSDHAQAIKFQTSRSIICISNNVIIYKYTTNNGISMEQENDGWTITDNDTKFSVEISGSGVECVLVSHSGM